MAPFQVVLTTALRQGPESVEREGSSRPFGWSRPRCKSFKGSSPSSDPAALDDLGLAPALGTLYARVGAGHGLRVTIESDLPIEDGSPADRLAPEIEGAIYRLVQEALTNIAKHANTDEAHVWMGDADGGVRSRSGTTARASIPARPRVASGS